MAELGEVGNKIKKICKNVEETNEIQKLLEKFEAEETDETEECIDILFGVFSFHIINGTWLKSSLSATTSVAPPETVGEISDSSVATKMVHSWLATNFESFLNFLALKLQSSSSQIQLKIFETFLRLISFEHEKGIETKLTSRMEKILLNLILSKISDETFTFVTELMENLDIQFAFLKATPIFCQREKFKTNMLAIENCLKLFQLITSNQINVKEDEATLYFSQDDKKMRKQYGKVYSEAWLAYLRVKLSPVLRKKILVDIDTKVIPFLSDPKELIDFLTDSYSAGGVTSLLALNGLYTLINQHNLDYPDFYENLYKIIDPSIFHMKYKSRFFHYIDMFLTSTHLPGYLVAAFIKKFSRMLLFIPTTDMLMMLTFIKNLLIRHQSTRVLIHRKKVKLYFIASSPCIILKGWI